MGLQLIAWERTLGVRIQTSRRGNTFPLWIWRDIKTIVSPIGNDREEKQYPSTYESQIHGHAELDVPPTVENQQSQQDGTRDPNHQLKGYK